MIKRPQRSTIDPTSVSAIIARANGLEYFYLLQLRQEHPEVDPESFQVPEHIKDYFLVEAYEIQHMKVHKLDNSFCRLSFHEKLAIVKKRVNSGAFPFQGEMWENTGNGKRRGVESEKGA